MNARAPYNAGDEAAVTKRQKTEREAEERLANGLTYVLAARPGRDLVWWLGAGRRADWLEALKWMMLADKSGFAPAQDFMNRLNSELDAEDIAAVRDLADAWRPSE